MRLSGILLVLLALGACEGRVDQQPVEDSQAANASDQGDNAALAGDRSPLAVPNGPIDPTSAEAADQVVQQYGALVEQRRFPDAEKLWSDSAQARNVSDQLGANREIHLAIGNPGELEGAAGSIYVTAPVVFYGKDKDSADFRRPAEIVLRRVNDVPGSTEAQRRWHIERIDWAD